MRLLADLHISPRTVEYLQSLGHDVVRVSQVLPPTSSDHQIIAYAVSDRRAILTQDLDFSAEIAVSGQAFPSVVLLLLSSSRIETVNTVLSDVLPTLEQDVKDGVLITVEDHRLRDGDCLSRLRSLRIFQESENKERPRSNVIGARPRA